MRSLVGFQAVVHSLLPERPQQQHLDHHSLAPAASLAGEQQQGLVRLGGEGLDQPVRLRGSDDERLAPAAPAEDEAGRALDGGVQLREVGPWEAIECRSATLSSEMKTSLVLTKEQSFAAAAVKAVKAIVDGRLWRSECDGRGLRVDPVQRQAAELRGGRHLHLLRGEQGQRVCDQRLQRGSDLHARHQLAGRGRSAHLPHCLRGLQGPSLPRPVVHSGHHQRTPLFAFPHIADGSHQHDSLGIAGQRLHHLRRRAREAHRGEAGGEAALGALDGDAHRQDGDDRDAQDGHSGGRCLVGRARQAGRDARLPGSCGGPHRARRRQPSLRGGLSAHRSGGRALDRGARVDVPGRQEGGLPPPPGHRGAVAGPQAGAGGPAGRAEGGDGQGRDRGRRGGLARGGGGEGAYYFSLRVCDA